MIGLAENKIGAFETTSLDDIKNRLYMIGKSKDTTSWWIRGIPIDARDVAEIVAKKHDMKLSAFLAEAIFNYAEHLETANDTDTDLDDGQASALQEFVARIEALENHLISADAPKRHDVNLKAQKLVTNLVERPWLKTS